MPRGVVGNGGFLGGSLAGSRGSWILGIIAAAVVPAVGLEAQIQYDVVPAGLAKDEMLAVIPGGSDVVKGPSVIHGRQFLATELRGLANTGLIGSRVAYHWSALDSSDAAAGPGPGLIETSSPNTRSAALSVGVAGASNASAHLSSAATKVYDLDASSERLALLDGNLVSDGSSAATPADQAPKSIFVPDSGTTDNVFLSYQLGAPGSAGGSYATSAAGIEEWNPGNALTFAIPTQVPEPGTWGAIGAMAVAGVATWRSQLKKRRRLQETTASTPMGTP